MFCIHYRCPCTIWRKYMLIRIQNSLSDEWFPAIYPLCTMICIKTETWAQRNWEYILPVSHVHTFSHYLNFLAYKNGLSIRLCIYIRFLTLLIFTLTLLHVHTFFARSHFSFKKKRTFSFSGHCCNKNW